MPTKRTVIIESLSALQDQMIDDITHDFLDGTYPIYPPNWSDEPDDSIEVEFTRLPDDLPQLEGPKKNES